MRKKREKNLALKYSAGMTPQQILDQLPGDRYTLEGVEEKVEELRKTLHFPVDAQTGKISFRFAIAVIDQLCPEKKSGHQATPQEIVKFGDNQFRTYPVLLEGVCVFQSINGRNIFRIHLECLQQLIPIADWNTYAQGVVRHHSSVHVGSWKSRSLGTKLSSLTGVTKLQFSKLDTIEVRVWGGSGARDIVERVARELLEWRG